MRCWQTPALDTGGIRLGGRYEKIKGGEGGMDGRGTEEAAKEACVRSVLLRVVVKKQQGLFEHVVLFPLSME